LLLTSGDTTESLPFPGGAPFAGEIADIEALVIDDGAQRIPLRESRRTVVTLSALYGSARSGQPQSL
jgi:hypothetical protein